MKREFAVGYLLSVMACMAMPVAADIPIRWKGTPGWEPESAYCRLYDAKRVETLNGTITRVEKAAPLKGMGEGVYFMLKTSKESIPVHLGPTEFVEKQKLQFFANDVVEVKGSRVTCDGKPVILAANVTKDSHIVLFRELKGRPLWAPGASGK